MPNRLVFLLACLGFVAAAAAARLPLSHADAQVQIAEQSALTLACSSRALDQSFNISSFDPNYKRLIRSTVKIPVNDGLTVTASTYKFEYETLTFDFIHIEDVLKTGKNAIVTLADGGIGQTRVSIKFQPCPNEGADYVIHTWGKSNKSKQ